MFQKNNLAESRNVAAQFLAYTFLKLFPSTHLVGGGESLIGFYYDFCLSQPLLENAIDFIETSLKTEIKKNHTVSYSVMMRENAKNFFEHRGQPLLADKAESNEWNIIPIIKIHDFVGLCPECTIHQSQEIGAIKLLNIETDESKRNIRINGACFSNPQELKQFVKNYDRYLKKGDHRELGPQMELFVQSAYSQVQQVWLPKGALLKKILVDWLSQHPLIAQSTPVQTPQFVYADKKEAPGTIHLDLDDTDYALAIGKTRQHIELLTRLAKQNNATIPSVYEWAPVVNQLNEIERWGLLADHSYTADYFTMCCRKKDLNAQLTSCLLFIEQIVKIFNFKAKWTITRSKHRKSRERFNQESIECYASIVRKNGYYLLEEKVEESDQVNAPRLRLSVEDELGRYWPLGEITKVLEEKNLNQLIKDCKEELNLVSFSLLGSLERFIGLLIERYRGELPFWLAPEQVRILVVGSNNGFAKQVYDGLRQVLIRVTLDARDLKLNEKVHQGLKEKVPYLVIIGEQEGLSKKVSVQSLSGMNKRELVELEQLIKPLLEEAVVPVLN